METGKVNVQFKFDGVLSGTSIPVEVRKENMSLVARGTEEFTLDEGTYYLSTRLPSGDEWIERVEVAAGSYQNIYLEAQEENRSNHEWLEPVHYLRPSRSAYQQWIPSPEDASSPEPTTTDAEQMWPPRTPTDSADGPAGLERLGGSGEARLRHFRGNPLVSLQEDPEPLVSQDYDKDALLHFIAQGGPELQWLQLAQPDVPSINMAIPVAPGSSCRVYVERGSDGNVLVQVHPLHPQADALLGYRESGTLDAVADLAELLLREKIEDPIAAAVGAYALLRFSRLEQLHDWTENLRQWFPWLPDGSAIRGEHLAREGDHIAAIDAFLELESRGLPIFNSGLGYAVDRLRTYVSLGNKEEAESADEPDTVKEARKRMGEAGVAPEPSPFSEAQQEQARILLEKLQRFIPFVNNAQSILAWTGIEPESPSDNKLSPARFTYQVGTELTSLLP